MGRLLFTLITAAICGSAGYFGAGYVLQNWVTLPASSQEYHATPHGIGLCFATLFGLMGTVWAWGRGSELR